MNKKKIIYVVIALILIVSSVIGVVIYQETKLTHDEQWALDCVQDLKSMLDSSYDFNIENNILTINYTDGYGKNAEEYEFTFVDYSYKNDLGKRINGCAIFDYGVYLTDYNKDVNLDDIDYDNEYEVNKAREIILAKIALEEYNCGKFKNKNTTIYVVDKNRIEKKIK